MKQNFLSIVWNNKFFWKWYCKIVITGVLIGWIFLILSEF